MELNHNAKQLNTCSFFSLNVSFTGNQRTLLAILITVSRNDAAELATGADAVQSDLLLGIRLCPRKSLAAYKVCPRMWP